MVGDHEEKTDVKAKAKHILHICAYHLISIPRISIFQDFLHAMFPAQREIESASKLQQLPWTSGFEDLQLVLRSAAAPGLTP